MEQLIEKVNGIQSDLSALIACFILLIVFICFYLFAKWFFKTTRPDKAEIISKRNTEMAMVFIAIQLKDVLEEEKFDELLNFIDLFQRNPETAKKHLKAFFAYSVGDKFEGTNMKHLVSDI